MTEGIRLEARLARPSVVYPPIDFSETLPPTGIAFELVVNIADVGRETFERLVGWAITRDARQRVEMILSDLPAPPVDDEATS